MHSERPINFSPGPCKLPFEVKIMIHFHLILIYLIYILILYCFLNKQVLKQAEHELCNYDQSGISVMGKFTISKWQHNHSYITCLCLHFIKSLVIDHQHL